VGALDAEGDAQGRVAVGRIKADQRTSCEGTSQEEGEKNKAQEHRKAKARESEQIRRQNTSYDKGQGAEISKYKEQRYICKGETNEESSK
jgi:hypothetical protein